jgi:hypothetical protein
MPAKKNTVALVNSYLKGIGRTERLTAGRGYYYFRNGDGLLWPSVYVYRASDLTLAQWIVIVHERINGLR